jgi:hypothetical protein
MLVNEKVDKLLSPSTVQSINIEKFNPFTEAIE